MAINSKVPEDEMLVMGRIASPFGVKGWLWRQRMATRQCVHRRSGQVAGLLALVPEVKGTVAGSRTASRATSWQGPGGAAEDMSRPGCCCCADGD